MKYAVFAGILQAPETSSKLSCRLCTAEVRGSNPLGSTSEKRIFAGKKQAGKQGRKDDPALFDSYLTVTRSSEGVPHRPRSLIPH
jgi:hypothetical protein